MLRLDGGNKSPTTEKTSGIIAPEPMDPMTLATMRNMNVGLSALRIVPTRQMIVEIINMMRRPYISENLPKTSVANAVTRLGIETAHEYKDIPSRSAAILGLAMVSVCMK